MPSRRSFLQSVGATAGLAATAGCVTLNKMVSDRLVIEAKRPRRIQSGTTVGILGRKLEAALKDGLYNHDFSEHTFRDIAPALWWVAGINVDDTLYRLKKQRRTPTSMLLRPEKVQKKTEDGEVKNLSEYPKREREAIRKAIKRGEYQTDWTGDPEQQFYTTTLRTYVRHNGSLYLLGWRQRDALERENHGTKYALGIEPADRVDGKVVTVKFPFDTAPEETRDYYLKPLTGTGKYVDRQWTDLPPKTKWVANHTDILATNKRMYSVTFVN